MTEPREQKRPFWLPWAKPDSPIYSRGWTIGSVSPSKRSTTRSQAEGSKMTEREKRSDEEQPQLIALVIEAGEDADWGELCYPPVRG